MNTVQAALQDILNTALQRAQQHGGKAFADKIQVVWNSRMRSAAGRAFWPDCRIELNPKLLKVELEEVRRTLLHELAHLLAYHRAGWRRIQPHGPEWQKACSDLGIPGERATHNLPLPSFTQRRRWKYTCPNCGESFERVRRLKGSSACYDCCKRYSRGHYHDRFALREERLLF